MDIAASHFCDTFKPHQNGNDSGMHRYRQRRACRACTHEAKLHGTGLIDSSDLNSASMRIQEWSNGLVQGLLNGLENVAAHYLAALPFLEG